MRNTLTFPPLPTSSAEVKPTFNLVIAYEDFETGKHAKKVYDFLVEHLGHECQFSSQMWKFDVLAVPKLRKIATRDAAEADIIMVSSHGTGELPEEVKAWTESWVLTKTRALALVALFGSEQVPENPVRSYLSAAARRAGLEFFCQPWLWPGDREDAFSAGDEERNGASEMLAGVLQQEKDISHWGINE